MFGIPSPLEGLWSPLFAAQIASGLSFESQTVIFGIAGQSNAIGRSGPIDPVLDATDTDILMWDATAGSFVTAADPLDHFGETADTIGYGLSFAKDFKTAFNPERIILVGLAEGSTGFVDGEWSPARRTTSTYVNARSRWDAAHAQALVDYGTAVVGGILWSQGEDEIQNHAALFALAGTHKNFKTMPVSLFQTMRQTWAGIAPYTPILLTSVPSGSVLTGSAGYANVQQALSDVPSVAPYTAFVDGTDLTTSDNLHWDAASMRTLGSRLASALSGAISNAISLPGHQVTLDPDNVETAILLDARPAYDGCPVFSHDGALEFDNKRVHIENGKFQFDGVSELRWRGDVSQKPRLSNRDFKLTFEAEHTGSTEGGIVSDWQTVGNARSFVIRRNGGNIEMYGSTDGSTSALLLQAPWDGTEDSFEIKRVGTSMTLRKGGVQVDSTTLAGGYTFYDSGNDESLHIGDHINNREFEGTMSFIALEFLS